MRLPALESFTDSFAFCVSALLLCFACAKPEPLLIERLSGTGELDKEPDAIHVAYLAVDGKDKRHFDIASCFQGEPGIEWYTTAETYRLFRDRSIPPQNIEDVRQILPLRNMNDFTFLLMALPRGRTVVLRSFRFQLGEVVESLVPLKNFGCESLYRWLNLIKVQSFPDGAYVFEDESYLGKTPRWLNLSPGSHNLHIEGLNGFVRKESVEIGKQVVLTVQPKKKNAKQQLIPDK